MLEPPATVAELLEQAHLSQYAAAFEEHGWDDVPQLFAINESELITLMSDTNMKSGHRARLLRALGKEGLGDGSARAAGDGRMDICAAPGPAPLADRTPMDASGGVPTANASVEEDAQQARDSSPLQKLISSGIITEPDPTSPVDTYRRQSYFSPDRPVVLARLRVAPSISPAASRPPVNNWGQMDAS